MKNDVKNLRKRIWIDPFQTGLVVRIVAYCLIFQLAAWVFFALSDQIDRYIESIGGEGRFFSSPFVRSMWALVLLLPPLALEVIRFSHRLVGPLFRLRNTIRAISKGEPVNLVQFRDGDLLGDLKDDFNLMLRHLEQKGLVVVKNSGATAGDVTHVTGETVPAAAALQG